MMRGNFSRHRQAPPFGPSEKFHRASSAEVRQVKTGASSLRQKNIPGHGNRLGNLRNGG